MTLVPDLDWPTNLYQDICPVPDEPTRISRRQTGRFPRRWLAPGPATRPDPWREARLRWSRNALAYATRRAGSARQASARPTT